MEGSGYKHEDNNYKCDSSRSKMKICFTNILSRDLKIVTFQPFHVYFSFHRQNFFKNLLKFIS
jgi:hypothetical protein